MESRLCRLRHRHDGAVHRPLAAQYEQADAGSHWWILPRSYWNVKKSWYGPAGFGRELHHHKGNIPKLKEELQKAIHRVANFDKLSKQIEITVTNEGLRVELLENQKGTFFDIGNANPSGDGKELLSLMAGEIGKLPNKVSIERHTDSKPYGRADYSNWELSVDRANAARRIMQGAGLGPTQVSQVRGFADQRLRVKDNPLDPSNRRISIIVHYLDKPLPTDNADPKDQSGNSQPPALAVPAAKPQAAENKD